MNGALEYYKNNESIWSISGYNIPIDIPSDYKHDVYLSYRGCSWVGQHGKIDGVKWIGM